MEPMRVPLRARMPAVSCAVCVSLCWLQRTECLPVLGGQSVVDKDGIQGLLGRGLYTRLLTNGLQASPDPHQRLGCRSVPSPHSAAPPSL